MGQAMPVDQAYHLASWGARQLTQCLQGAYRLVGASGGAFGGGEEGGVEVGAGEVADGVEVGLLGDLALFGGGELALLDDDACGAGEVLDCPVPSISTSSVPGPFPGRQRGMTPERVSRPRGGSRWRPGTGHSCPR